MATRIANVLTIAGVDPSGGAGILADVKTFSALGAYACGVVAALTAQNTRGVDRHLRRCRRTSSASRSTRCSTTSRIDAVKIGMVGQERGDPRRSPTGLRALAGRAHVVLDPVMVAKSGDALLERTRSARCARRSCRSRRVITPEPARGRRAARPRHRRRREGMRRRPSGCARLAPAAALVLLKGGHLTRRRRDRHAHDGDRMIELPRRASTRRTRTAPAARCRPRIAALLPQARRARRRAPRQGLPERRDRASGASTSEGPRPGPPLPRVVVRSETQFPGSRGVARRECVSELRL